MENDRNYFTRRALEERSAAGKASGKAREAHEAMAGHYEALAQTAREPEQLEPTSVQPASSA